jgi:hypothetical protein
MTRLIGSLRMACHAKDTNEIPIVVHTTSGDQDGPIRSADCALQGLTNGVDLDGGERRWPLVL